MRFRLVPKLSTLDDLERADVYSVAEKQSFWRPLQNLNEDSTLLAAEM